MNVDGPSGSIIPCREPVGVADEPYNSVESTRVPDDDASREYFLKRERAERDAAKQARSDKAKFIHDELARIYAGLSCR